MFLLSLKVGKRIRSLIAMTDDFRMYPTVQHSMLTLKELLSSEQLNGGSFYRSANGVVFDNVEVVGKVTNPRSGDDFAKFTLATEEGDLEIAVVESGMFRDDALSDFISKIPDESFVLVRGKYSEYVTTDGGTGRNIRPKSVNIFTDRDDLEAWYYKLLASRIMNSFPVFVQGKLESIGDEMGLERIEVDGMPGMIRYDYTIDRQEPEVIRQRDTATKRDVTMPAPRPQTPARLKKIIEKKRAVENDLVALIIDASGMDENEIEDRIDEMKDEFDMFSREEILVAMARDFGIDVDAFKKNANKAPVKKKETGATGKRAVERPKTDDPKEAILAYVKGSGGEIPLETLRSSMKEDGFTSKDIESAIMSLFADKKIGGDTTVIELL